MTKSINTRLDEKTVRQIEGAFESIYEGARTAIESFFLLRRHIQPEIKGIFTKNELSAIVDIFNGTIFDPQFAQKTVLKGELEDAQQLDGILTKWDVNPDEIFTKVDNLSETQAFWIIFEAWNFWYNPASVGSPVLETFIEKYT